MVRLIPAQFLFHHQFCEKGEKVRTEINALLLQLGQRPGRHHHVEWRKFCADLSGKRQLQYFLGLSNQLERSCWRHPCRLDHHYHE